MSHRSVVLSVLLAAALAAGASLANDSDQAGSGTLYEATVPSGPHNTAQFDAQHQNKVRDYFSNHKEALVPPTKADGASVKLGAPIPGSVHLFPLPDAIFDDMPSMPVYLYCVVGKDIVVADLDTRVAVSIIPYIPIEPSPEGRGAKAPLP